MRITTVNCYQQQEVELWIGWLPRREGVSSPVVAEVRVVAREHEADVPILIKSKRILPALVKQIARLT